MKYWEIIADKLKNANDLDCRPDHDDGKHFVVRGDELCITDSKLDAMI